MLEAMAFDEQLGIRIRDLLETRPDIDEQRMFGGIAFLVEGRMFCGIVGDDLMVRVGPERYAAALARKHVRAMDFTGRPFVGYVYVAKQGIASEASLREWVDAGLSFASTLPAGTSRAKKSRAKKASAKKTTAKTTTAKKTMVKKASAKKKPRA